MVSTNITKEKEKNLPSQVDEVQLSTDASQEIMEEML